MVTLDLACENAGMRLVSSDGCTVVDVIRLSCTRGRDGEWLRVRRGRWHVGDVRTVGELAALGVDLADMDEAVLARPFGGAGESVVYVIGMRPHPVSGASQGWECMALSSSSKKMPLSRPRNIAMPPRLRMAGRSRASNLLPLTRKVITGRWPATRPTITVAW